MPVEIGIVGAGNRGHTHTRAYSEVDGADVVAVADIDQDAATELADEHGVPAVYEDFRAMFADAGLDAVSVCVHNNLHRPVAEAAADAGLHVFSEKPLAATYTDAKAIADACDDDGVYEFLFTAAPLKVERGSGAPINPVVLKATGGGQGNGGPNGNGRQ